MSGRGGSGGGGGRGGGGGGGAGGGGPRGGRPGGGGGSRGGRPAGRPDRPGGRPDKPAGRPDKPGGTGRRPEPARGQAPAAGGSDPNVIYGRNAVHEALRAKLRPVRSLWATEQASHEPWLRGVDVRISTSDEIASRCGSDGHQGVCAIAGRFPYAEGAALLRADAPLIVALDEVQDVQNLGSITRTAECAGATGLVIPERRSAEVTAAAGKASAGAIEHLPIARVRNLADFLAEAKTAGLWVYGAAGEAGSTPWTDIDWTGGVVLVMGAEGKGLRPRVADSCDALVALPLRGSIGSLNVGAAAAALLYEAVRARG
ncbi:23S rRNA (guanosine(2251)-2'-O)-methyltransferase RlmB [Paraconexibacter antarcticus]|uniref:23S rRNA (Guanosine(2251)-2'-O)-methyltransferase RlmB n=1 Tax=Paraconexibacter antarcticus TaxID=2949664 RepID=A0ABY5DZ92_9ACTN|nr:23S rRNA (guanosine(2251)-2'-O)-methyltransferase RlmB [Paraconexibacter antarcticus]UTI66526.1 23S rRNA (guanosine(2251)-2'-O)-methyltransferase RlmB [Paraconexibacter antarcticus]